MGNTKSAKPIQQDSEEKAIIGRSQLIQIHGDQLDQLLHRSIVAIRFLLGAKIAVGSGVLISPNLVLTAAHNLFTKKKGIISQLSHDIKSFQVFIKANGIAQEYFEVEDWRYVKKFQTCLDEREVKIEFDYALLKLKENPKMSTNFNQFLELSLPCECMLRKDPQLYLELYGYPFYLSNYLPLSKPQQKIQRIRLWQYGATQKNCIVELNPSKYTIKYAISTEPGHSGSPIVAHNKCIVAIHANTGVKNQQFNIGRLVTKDLIENIQVWAREMKGSPFKINNNGDCPHKQRGPKQENYSEKIEKIAKQAQAHKRKGDEYLGSSKYVMALQSYQRALKMIQEANGRGSQQRADVLNQMGVANYNQGNYPKALEYYLQCLQIEQRVKGKGCIDSATTLNNIGEVYRNQGNYPKSKSFYRSAIAIYQNLSVLYSGYANTQQSLGAIYLELKDYESATESFQISLKTFEKMDHKDRAKRVALELMSCLKILKRNQRLQQIKKRYGE